ncbi:MAG: hypothetical protein KatS3mg084_0422 [Candidatus Dojkabacteria bacterium]|nr:MAG: hypothetical protein KatS3mg084_0422 [Candidatus Dojkabacteria bacterium]
METGNLKTKIFYALLSLFVIGLIGLIAIIINSMYR